MNPCPSQGFGLDNSHAGACAQDNDVHAPLSVRPYDADLLKLDNCFQSLACRVKAISKSALKVNSDIDVVQKALGGNFVLMKTHFWGEKGFDYHCELNISGVEIACSHASTKKQAKHAAFSAAVELMKKSYVCLLEVPEFNYSYKLIGSDQPFVGVTSGVLSYDQYRVVTDKGQIVEEKQSAEQGTSIDSHQWHSSDVTCDSGKVKLEASFAESLNSSQAASAVPEDLYETQVSAVAYGMRVSELQSQFRALAHRVKSISKSSLEVHNSTDVIDTALADTQMQKKRLIVWLSSIACRCEFSVDGVVLSYGGGDTKEQAKEAAYNAAFELLSKPHLQLQGNSESKQSYRLVGCDEPFVASSHVPPTEPHRKFVATDKISCREKCPPVSAKIGKTSSSCANESALCLQQRVETFPAQGLANFVILQSHFRKAHRAAMNVLQQSASFNNWPLSYNLTTVEEGRRCLLTLGGHTLADIVEKGKKSAQKAAAGQALKKLSSTCYTLKVKQYDIAASALTRNEVWIIIK